METFLGSGFFLTSFETVFLAGLPLAGGDGAGGDGAGGSVLEPGDPVLATAPPPGGAGGGGGAGGTTISTSCFPP